MIDARCGAYNLSIVPREIPKNLMTLFNRTKASQQKKKTGKYRAMERTFLLLEGVHRLHLLVSEMPDAKGVGTRCAELETNNTQGNQWLRSSTLLSENYRLSGTETSEIWKLIFI